MSTRIGVFASGNGSNAINLYKYFNEHSDIEFHKIYCNNPEAGIITKAFSYDIPLHVFTRSQLNSGQLLEQIKQDKIDVLVLAGFLWLVPTALIDHFPQRIINIHPALLPQYGGKGMYGMRIHQLVIENKESESGITIHLVDEQYDHGDQLFQGKLLLDKDETPETLASKIHELEYAHFPAVVEKHVESLTQQSD